MVQRSYEEVEVKGETEKGVVREDRLILPQDTVSQMMWIMR
jgi:hypothetical protein